MIFLWKVELNEMLKIVEPWRTEDTDKFFYEIEEKKMIKRKDKAFHYWHNHKIESIVFVVLVIALIIK